MNISGTWAIDPAHSSVEFIVRHMMVSRVKGRFSGVSGTVVIPESGFAGAVVEVDIDASTVDTRDGKRDEHLRSNDFFGTGDHPKILFRSTRIVPKGGDAFDLHGDLSIRGVTRPVVLDARYLGQGVNPWGMTVAGFEASTAIEREDYGVTWNAPLEAGGVIVSNEVKISLDIEVIKQG